MARALDSRTDSPAIVANETFILATRDTGYRDVTAAVAELIDNSLQAGAALVQVLIRDEHSEEGRSITLGVLDDGHGMSAKTLQTALQFGGSDRFGDRSGLGRFGMGLPNSSVSQTRRFDVFSWQATPNAVLHSYLDVDEVVSGRLRTVPTPVASKLPDWVAAHASGNGTLVLWTRCDRLGRLRAGTVAQRLCASLGRLYRYALWAGVRISVNETRLVPVDPLFLNEDSRIHGASAFGSPLTYEFATLHGASAEVQVQFSELPVEPWHRWTTEAKRRAGIVGGAGVSIVRAGREIDYGWYFMGKRRENYDDWWRCEVRFSPGLDELFGVTHSKQGISPTTELRAILAPDLEAIARTLNARVRAAFEAVKTGARSTAVCAADSRDRFLPPPQIASLRSTGIGLSYRIDAGALAGPEFYRVDLVDTTIVVTLNSDHPFYTNVYKLVCQDQRSRERYHIECMVLAAARADLEAADEGERHYVSRSRRYWADALAAFLDT